MCGSRSMLRPGRLWRQVAQRVCTISPLCGQTAISCAWRSATASAAFAPWSRSGLMPQKPIPRSACITRRRCGSSAPCATSTAPIRSACRTPGHGWTMAVGRVERTSVAMSSCRSRGKELRRIPVGPVHAGIIEPGHFRFTANGETVVRLEERLGYAHKGVEALFVGADMERGARLVGRLSGDSTVSYAWAYARAVEAALGWPVPPRAILLRGVMAELERMAHHISDVGAICNDASVIAVHAQCALQREDVLATSQVCFGHRLMMDCVVPGGVAADLSSDGIGRVRGLWAAWRQRGRDPARLQLHALASGSHRHHRHRLAGPGPSVCRRWLCRPRIGPRLRRAQDLRLCALRWRGLQPQDAHGRRRRCPPDGSPGRDR